MSEPKELMRFGVMRDWLEADYGIPPAETRKLAELDVIKGRPLHAGGRDFYRKGQIMKDVIEPRQSAEEQTLEVQRPVEPESKAENVQRSTSNTQHSMQNGKDLPQRTRSNTKKNLSGKQERRK